MNEPEPETTWHIVAQRIDAAFSRINPNHKRVKSPAEQFSESHHEWLKNGREA